MKDPRAGREADRLRARRAQVAHDDPDVGHRLAAVTDRVRRQQRRRGIITGVAVAAVAAAIVVTPQFLSTSPTTNDAVVQPAQPRVSIADGAANEPLALAACPDAPVDIATSEVEQDTTSTIGSSASSMRLCRAQVGTAPTPGWRPPADALVLSNGATFFTALDDAPAADPDRCAAIRVLPDPYALLVGYPGGRLETVVVSNQCIDLTVAGRLLASGDVLQAFQEALAEQRQRSRPAVVETPDLDCADPPPAGFTTVAVTRGPGPSEQTRFAAFVTCHDRPTYADTAAVAALNEQWPSSVRNLVSRGSGRPADRCASEDAAAEPAYGVTTWGDVLLFELAACGSYHVGGFGAVSAESNGAQSARLQFLPSEPLVRALRLR